MSTAKNRRNRRLACEQLEIRALCTAASLSAAPADLSAPVVAPVVEVGSVQAKAAASQANAQAAVAARQTLAQYMVGTWVHTIGFWYGKPIQLRQIFQKTGVYVVQRNYRLDAWGIPHSVSWYNVDRGTWRVTAGVISARSNFGSYSGRVSNVYVRVISQNLADVGVLPSNANPGTKPDWMHFARMV